MHFRSGLLLLAVLSLFGCGGNGDDGPIKTSETDQGAVQSAATQFFLAVSAPTAATRSRASSPRATNDAPVNGLTKDNFSAEVLIPDTSDSRKYRPTRADVATFENFGDGVYRVDIDGTPRVDTIIYVTINNVTYKVLAIKAGTRAEPVAINVYTTAAVDLLVSEITSGSIDLNTATTDSISQRLDDITKYLETLNIPTGLSVDDTLDWLSEANNGCSFATGCASVIPEHFTESYLAGKTFYLAEYIPGSAQTIQIASPATTAVYKLQFGKDGVLTRTGILNPAEADYTIDYHVDTVGRLYFGQDTNAINRISCGSTTDYIQIDDETGGVDLGTSRLFSDQAKATDFANSNPGTPIPRCVPASFSYEYLAGRELYQVYISGQTRSTNVIERVKLNVDGSATTIAGLDTTGTSIAFTWSVDRYGTLIVEKDQPGTLFNGEEGYRATCGATESYFKTNHMFNNHDIQTSGQTDVNFFAFDEITASTLTDTINTDSSIYQACSVDKPPVNLVGGWRSADAPQDSFVIFLNSKSYFYYEGATTDPNACGSNGFEFGDYGWSRSLQKIAFTALVNGDDCGPPLSQAINITLAENGNTFAAQDTSTFTASRMLADPNNIYVGAWGTSGTDVQNGPVGYSLNFLADGHYLYLAHNTDEANCPPGDSYEFGTYSIDPQTASLSVTPSVLHGSGCTLATGVSSTPVQTLFQVYVEGDSLSLYNAEIPARSKSLNRLK